MTSQLAALGQQHPPAMPVLPTRLCPQTAGPWAQQAAKGPSVLCRLSPTWCRAAAPEALGGAAPRSRSPPSAPPPGGALAPPPSAVAPPPRCWPRPPRCFARARESCAGWGGGWVVVSTGALSPAPVFIPKYIYFANCLVGFV